MVQLLASDSMLSVDYMNCILQSFLWVLALLTHLDDFSFYYNLTSSLFSFAAI